MYVHILKENNQLVCTQKVLLSIKRYGLLAFGSFCSINLTKVPIKPLQCISLYSSRMGRNSTFIFTDLHDFSLCGHFMQTRKMGEEASAGNSARLTVSSNHSNTETACSQNETGNRAKDGK